MRAFAHDDEQAEDLTQEAFCRVHQHAGNYAAQRNFVAWLKRIAVNLAKDFLRKQRQAPIGSLNELEETQADDNHFDPMAVLTSEMLHKDLRAAKANHPEDPFISALPTVEPDREEDSINPPQLNVLFIQLRIALELLQEKSHAVEGTGKRKPSPLDDIESRLADVSAQMQVIAERLSGTDVPPEEMQRLARDLSQLGQRQAELAQRRATLRSRDE
jgi:RNA polymerase sigma factor (sigma-70 family)